MQQLLVNIDVDDLPGATAFYRTAFGLDIGRRFGDDGVELTGASSRIYLLARKSGSHACAPARTSAITAVTGRRCTWTSWSTTSTLRCCAP